MAEEWIEKLAHAIKGKDHEAAEQDAAATRRAELINHEGPIFWRSFADFLKKYTEEMRGALDGDVTAAVISFTFQPQSQRIDIHKSAYPYIMFNASPGYGPNQSVSMQYLKTNPKQPQNIVQKMQAIPCRFEVSHHHKVFLHLDGKEFPEPQHAAKYLIEKLFTLE